MPKILYGKSAYKRSNGNLPELKLVNMFVESAPTADSGVTILSRLGLEESSEVGAGPTYGVFSQPGTYDGDLFTLSGNTLYRGSDALGYIDGGGPVSWAASAREVVVTRGATAYSYNGFNLQPISFPDAADVTSVTFLAGLFVFARANTHRFYWSAVLDSRTIDALDFASAENEPDELLDTVRVGDYLFLLGQNSTEVWAPGGTVDAPFRRIEGRLYGKGVISTGCAWEQDNSLTFVGHDGMVYRIAEVPQRISDHGIEERIQESGSVLAFTFIHEGHNFFCIRLDLGTFVFDAATGQWCEFQTYNRSNFRVRCAATQGRTVLLGDDQAGKVWTLAGHEDGTDPVVKQFTGAFPLKGGKETVDSLDVEANTGHTDLLSGQGSQPILEMRASRDATATWGTYRQANLGSQGRYRTRTRYRRVGSFDAPGAVFDFRCSDPVPLRVSSVTVNEPGGGRSR